MFRAVPRFQRRLVGFLVSEGCRPCAPPRVECSTSPGITQPFGGGVVKLASQEPLSSRVWCALS